MKGCLRKIRVTFVISEKEEKMLKENAEKEQMSISEYVRFMSIYNGGKQ